MCGVKPFFLSYIIESAKFIMKAEEKLLLQKFLKGRCSDKELAQVKVLLEQPGVDGVLDELITIQSGEQWYGTLEPDQALLDLTARKKAEAAKRFAEGKSSQPELKKRWLFGRLNILQHAAIWAGVILVGTLAVWQYKNVVHHTEQVAYVERVNSKGLPLRYVLPDSSEVFLGAASSLRYPENFKGDTREIELQGEAFFQVNRNPEKPFIIHTGNVQTKVLGTSFKVEAFGQNPIVVSVATGKVGVSQHTGNTSKTLALLTPGKQVIWDQQKQVASEHNVDIYSLESWKTGDLSFEEQPLSAIVGEIQRRFGVKIHFADATLAETRVSVTFPAGKPIENVMYILSETGRFSYQTTDNLVYKIYPKK